MWQYSQVIQLALLHHLLEARRLITQFQHSGKCILMRRTPTINLDKSSVLFLIWSIIHQRLPRYDFRLVDLYVGLCVLLDCGEKAFGIECFVEGGGNGKVELAVNGTVGRRE